MRRGEFCSSSSPSLALGDREPGSWPRPALVATTGPHPPPVPQPQPRAAGITAYLATTRGRSHATAVLSVSARVALLGVLGSGVVRAQDAPLSIPLHDPAYAALQGLERSGCAAARVSPYRPFSVPQVRAALARALNDGRCTGGVLDALVARYGAAATDSAAPVQGGAGAAGAAAPVHVGGSATLRATSLGTGEFRPLWEDLRTDAEGDPPVVGLVRVRARWAPRANVVGVVEGYAQSHRRNDPLMRARQLRSTSGAVGISEATLAAAWGPLTLSFGRDREAWLGRGTESLILSAHGPALDRLALSLSTKHFQGRALYAMLDDVVLDTLRGELPSGTPDQRFHRALIAHSLTWRPNDGFEVSAGETVVLSRGSRTLDLGYANPLMPFIVTQNDAGREGSETRDNIAAFIAVRGQVGRSTAMAELLIDDIQIDGGDRELTPDQLGWRLEGRQGWGGRYTGSAGLEYARLNTFTYLRGYYTDVYQFVGRPLGSELGPDADRMQLEAEAWIASGLRLSSRAGVWRRGARRIGMRPSEGAVGNAGESFPSTSADRPAVQRATIGDIMVEIVDWRIPVVARLEAARFENPGHAVGGRVTHVRAHLNATYAFRYP